MEVSILDSVVSVMGEKVAALNCGNDASRTGHLHDSYAPYDILPCEDGWVALAVTEDAQWTAFCKEFGQEAWAEAYATNEQRRAAYLETLRPQLVELLSHVSREAFDSRCASAGVPAGPVNTMEEAIQSEHLKVRDMMPTVLDQRVGNVLTVGKVIRYNGEAGDTFATSQILAAAINKIGLDQDDIVFCGRQAIDGDTAQVGPQIAEKLGKMGFMGIGVPKEFGGAGSDAANVQTIAVLDGDEYVINGSKCFISNMGPSEGDFVNILAITDPTKGYKGMSTIIIDRNTPGFIIGKREEKMGIRAADVSELIFEDCRVPKTNLLGKEGNGFKIFMEALDGGRVGMASQALGIAEEALQIYSGYGYMRDYPLERMYRDARITPIYEGTSEIQKNIIAREEMSK